MINLRTSAFLTVAIASSLILQSCSQSGPATGDNSTLSQTKIILTGSSTVAPLASEIGKRFEAENPGLRVDVQTGGSSRGITDAREGVADLGMISRSLKAEEQDLKAFPIALDGITIILHEDNPVSTLSDSQVQQIYTGQITNWQEVGGPNTPITVVNKAEGRSTLELFLKYFALEPTNIQAQVIIGDNEQGIKTIAGNANSIGYVSIGTAETSVELDVPIKLLPVNGVEASTQNVSDGTFPLSRQLNLITTAAPQDTVKAFIEFAQSPEVYDIVENQSFVVFTQE